MRGTKELYEIAQDMVDWCLTRSCQKLGETDKEISLTCPNLSCPSRDKGETHKSFDINKDTALYHCWHCGLKGIGLNGPKGLIAHLESGDFSPPAFRSSMSSNACAFFKPKEKIVAEALMSRDELPKITKALGKEASTYLEKRGIPEYVYKDADLRIFSLPIGGKLSFMKQPLNDAAIFFPLRNDNGEVIHVHYKLLHGGYYMSQGPKPIYLTKATALNTTVVVEGVFDALSVYTAGYRGAALLGHEITSNHDLSVFEGKNVVVMLDNDEVGQLSVEKVASPLLSIAKEVRISQIPAEIDGHKIKDANDVLVKAGVEKLKEIIQGAKIYDSKKAKSQTSAKTEKAHKSDLSPDAISALRNQLGLSQRQLAKLVGVKRLAIARWESGTRLPSPENIKRLLQIAKENGLDTKLDTLDTKNVSKLDTNSELDTKNVSKLDTNSELDTKNVSKLDTNSELDTKNVSSKDTKLDTKSKVVSSKVTKKKSDESKVTEQNVIDHATEETVKNKPKKESVGGVVFPQEAWRGLFETYRQAQEGTTEAPDHYHFAVFKTITGAIIGRSCYLWNGRYLYPNFFTVLIGPTKRSRKTTAKSRGEALLADTDPLVIILRGLATSEGMLGRLQVPEAEELDGLPEIEQQRAMSVSKHEGYRMLVVCNEFASLLKKAKRESSSGLIQVLTDAYDCQDSLDNPTRLSPLSARKPFVSMIGLSTKEWLEANLDVDDIHGGFVNRNTFYLWTPTQPLYNPNKVLESPLNEIKRRLHEIRKSRKGMHVEYTFSDASDALLKEWYDNNYYTEYDSDIVSAASQRIDENVRKLALLYAVLENNPDNIEIHADQLQAAIAVGKYWEATVMEIFGKFGTSRATRSEIKILELLSRKSITKRDLHQSLSGSITAKQLDESLRHLLSVERVKIINEDYVDKAGKKRRRKLYVLNND